MEMTKFNKQFVERTKKIVHDYCTNGCEYDVTLLLNCLLGLVSLPIEQARVNEISFQNECVNKLELMRVLLRTSNDNKTFHSIKNALSHMYIDIENKHGIVESVYFSDKRSNSNTNHTEMKFTIAQLKEFALFVADKHLERVNNQ